MTVQATVHYSDAYFDSMATRLLAATNGPATVAVQLQHLDADVSTRAAPADVHVTVTADGSYEGNVG